MEREIALYSAGGARKARNELSYDIGGIKDFEKRYGAAYCAASGIQPRIVDGIDSSSRVFRNQLSRRSPSIGAIVSYGSPFPGSIKSFRCYSFLSSLFSCTWKHGWSVTWRNFTLSDTPSSFPNCFPNSSHRSAGTAMVKHLSDGLCAPVRDSTSHNDVIIAFCVLVLTCSYGRWSWSAI